MQIYLSYPKPSVLDMKQENHDINVIEQANIPKFSKLDNIGIPHRCFELFFDNILIDMSVGYTRFYGYEEKSDTSFEITNETFSLFQACYCLVGVISFQTVNCIGGRPPILSYKQHGVQRGELPPQKFVPLPFAACPSI